MEWKVEKSFSYDLEENLNRLDKQGYEIFKIHSLQEDYDFLIIARRPKATGQNPPLP